ncbi:MAG: DUF4328 domain-containing protein [Bacteroidia bacterium]|nr:DUF4328 domain-containing protein [Bacteroidia bacterium]
MAYYNWEKIVAGYSESELQRIYREKDKEPTDKVDATIGEMIKRGLLSADFKFIPKPSIEEFIINISEVSGTKSNIKKARYTIAIIAVFILIDIAVIVISAMQYQLLDSVEKGLPVTNEMIFNNNIRELVVIIVYLLVYVFSTIIFLKWFKSAYDNLHKRFSKCEYASGWAIGWWFIPVVSLYKPYYIMKEMITNNSILILQRGISVRKNYKTYYLGLWWTLWLFTHIISIRPFDIDNLYVQIFYTILTIVVAFLDILLVFFTISMIKRFSYIEELLYKSEIKNNQITMS